MKKQIMPSKYGFGNNRKAKKAAIASQPGTTKLEKRLNYAGAKARAKKANKAAVKKASSVSAVDRKSKQATATASHSKRLAEATAKYGKKKATPAKVKTKRGTGVTYKAAWDADKGGVKSKYKNYEAFKKAAVAYNSRKDSTGVMKSDANKMGPKNKK